MQLVTAAGKYNSVCTIRDRITGGRLREERAGRLAGGARRDGGARDAAGEEAGGGEVAARGPAKYFLGGGIPNGRPWGSEGRSA
jgi:hypothetical protein